jgi:hypothetical protein
MKNKGTNASVYIALLFLLGSLSAAGCAIWVPADSVAPQASEQSQTTTTTSQNVPVSTTKTTTVRTSAY